MCDTWEFAKREVGGKMGLFGARELPHKTVTMDFRKHHRREFGSYTTKKALLRKCLFKMVLRIGIELVSPGPLPLFWRGFKFLILSYTLSLTMTRKSSLF